MGTSKSYEGAKGHPNWSQLSGSVNEKHAKQELFPFNSLSNVTSNFAKFLGGSNFWRERKIQNRRSSGYKNSTKIRRLFKRRKN